MRTTPIIIPKQEREPRQPVTPPWYASILGHIARALSGRQQAPEHEPATEGAATLGRFVAANLDQSRLSLVVVHSAPQESTTAYTLTDATEYLRSQRHSQPGHRGPQARAILRLIGRNYRRLSDTTDNFMCTFGVVSLEGGARLIQAAPYQWEGPSGTSEYEAMHSALRELFGEDGATQGTKDLARINLGIIQPDGQFSPLRDFNQHAFGADLVPILDRISSPAAEEVGLRLQLNRGQIEQF